MYAKLDDAALMGLVVEGNHDAFAEIVTRHTAKFFALAFRTLQSQSDADDVVQAAFVKLWQNPTAWQKGKSKFTTWFYRVILNACHDYQRKHSRTVNIENEGLDAISPPLLDEQERLEHDQQQRWQQHCLALAIKRLPSSQRDALNLVVYGEMPQKQAAKVLGTTVKAIESLLVRAKRSIANTVSELEANQTLANRASHGEGVL